MQMIIMKAIEYQFKIIKLKKKPEIQNISKLVS